MNIKKHLEARLAVKEINERIKYYIRWCGFLYDEDAELNYIINDIRAITDLDEVPVIPLNKSIKSIIKTRLASLRLFLYYHLPKIKHQTGA